MYKVKYNNCENFKQNDIVKYCSCTYSGLCYLVADINDNSKREWIMNYELEKI